MNLRDQSMGAANFQSLRSAVAQGLAIGETRSASQVLDRLEAKYAGRVGAEKSIDAITKDSLHEDASVGGPISNEGLDPRCI